MAESTTQSEQRDFRCIHCAANIRIPRAMPPTTGPCPVCNGIITSPAEDAPEEFVLPQPVAQPATSLPPPREARPKSEAAAEKTTDAPEKIRSAKETSAPPKRSNLLLKIIGGSIIFLLIVGGIASAVYMVQKEMQRKATIDLPGKVLTDNDPKEVNYIRTGWKNDAAEVLRDYIAATTSAGKLPHILNADQLAQKVEDFYAGGKIIDSDTPADAFSIFELSEEDRKRGIFLMVYDQPPQFDIKEFFRPLATLEVQHGLEQAGLLLSTVARAENFALEPVRVQAFFKRTPDGLKLDWEIFAQTKYRTFQNFVELPEPGDSKVFRVFIVEDVPQKGRAVSGSRTYRLADPANLTDSARVNVMVDSEPGRALSLINWRGTTENRPITLTATVELSWTNDPNQPELQISRFICWEFLGLGGQASPASTGGR